MEHYGGRQANQEFLIFSSVTVLQSRMTSNILMINSIAFQNIVCHIVNYAYKQRFHGNIYFLRREKAGTMVILPFLVDIYQFTRPG